MSDGAGAILRTLTVNDIPAAVALSEQAGWNQTGDDWRLLIELTPQGCLALEADGELAATTTLMCYGRRLAWIGMVLTKMSYRGRGFAQRLLKHALTLAKHMQIETVKLDATDQGRPLYEKLGFRCEQPVERWSRQGTGNPSYIALPANEPPADNWWVTDHFAFGADRSKLLEHLGRRSRRAQLSAGSYVLSRPGRQTEYLGPSVCDAPGSARTLIERALQDAGSRGWSWDLLPRNTSAVAIAQDLEFRPTRHLQRMVRGKSVHAREDAIYAIAGFELG